MAVQEVYRPKKKQDDTFQKMQQVGGLVSLIPGGQVWGAAISGAGMLGQMANPYKPEPVQPEQVQSSQDQGLDMPDYSKALARRQEGLERDPFQSLVDARDALDKMELDEETRLKLRQPLDKAIMAQRSIG